jgi:N-acetyl-1-D-myo-inositol-2-amino-2-deoxy-alpha-D-glucopyranoside deacetylase
VPLAVRAVLHIVALAAGVTVGVLGSFVHPLTWHGLPYGLLLGLVLTGALMVAAGLATSSRSAPLLAAAGWLVVVVTLSSPRSEGDLVVPGTALGYAWLLAGTFVVVLGVMLPYRLLARPTRPAPSQRLAPSGTAPIGR